MPLGREYARSLVAKAKPDPMAALEAEPETDEAEPADEDADEAQLQSAYADFAAAAGIKASPKTLSSLQEIIRLTVK